MALSFSFNLALYFPYSGDKNECYFYNVEKSWVGIFEKQFRKRCYYVVIRIGFDKRNVINVFHIK